MSPCSTAISTGVAAAAKELGGQGRSALPVDITDWERDQGRDRLRSWSKFGKIDGLVNCAAIVGKTNLLTHEVEIENFDECYQINLRGAFLLSKAVCRIC